MGYAWRLGSMASAGMLTVPTAQALRDYPVSDLPAIGPVHTLGALAAGDDGAQVWRWDADETADDNLGTVLLPTGHVGAGRWVAAVSTVSLCAFGVIAGDSGSSVCAANTAGFQAAWAWAQSRTQGAEIRIPAGQFWFDPISVCAAEVANDAPISITGAGGCTKLLINPTAAPSDWLLRIDVAPISGNAMQWLRVSSIALMGNLAGNLVAANGVYLGSSNNCRFIDIDVQRFAGVGLQLDGCYDGYFERARIKNCGSYATQVPGLMVANNERNGNFAWFSDFVVEGCEYLQAEMVGAINFKFVSGKFHGIADAGAEVGLVRITGASIVDFESVLFTRCMGSSDLSIHDVGGVDITGTSYTRAALNGCSFQTTGNVTASHTAAIENHNLINWDCSDTSSYLSVDGLSVTQPFGTGGYFMRLTDAAPSSSDSKHRQIRLGAANVFAKQVSEIPVLDLRSSGAGESLAAPSKYFGLSVKGRQDVQLEPISWYAHDELWRYGLTGTDEWPAVFEALVTRGDGIGNVYPNIVGPFGIQRDSPAIGNVLGSHRLLLADSAVSGRSIAGHGHQVVVRIPNALTQDYAGGNYFAARFAWSGGSVDFILDSTQADEYYSGTSYKEFVYAAQAGALRLNPADRLSVSLQQTGSPATAPTGIEVETFVRYQFT